MALYSVNLVNLVNFINSVNSVNFINSVNIAFPSYIAKKTSLKQLFNYRPEIKGTPRNRTILLEYGEHFCCWAVWSRDAGRILKMDYYTFNDEAQKNICSLVDIIRNETETVNAIITCSYFPQSVLMPSAAEFVNENLATVVYREKLAVSCTDGIRERKIVNNYLVPSAVHSAIKKNFPHSPFYHAYTPYLKNTDPTAPDHISAHFSPGSCRVIVVKNNLLQLAQIYSYAAPLDIVYVLLKIFTEFQLPKNETVIYLSGLIEKNSALYEDLYAYFMNLEFAVPATPAVEGEDYPAHYFTSLANLAKCVS